MPMTVRSFGMWIATMIASAGVHSGAESTAHISAEEESAFKWFSSVVVMSSNGLQPVEIWTGATSQGGDGTLQIRSITKPGFLIQRDGKRFSTLSLWLNRQDFTESDKLDAPERVCCEIRTMDEFVAPIRAIDEVSIQSRNERQYGFPDYGWRTRPPESPALTDFIVAWHCWNQDRPDLAAFFLERMRNLHLDETTTKAGGSIRQQLKADAAKFLFDRIVISFDDPNVTRADLRIRLRGFMQHFNTEPDAPRARCLADAMDSLIKEEQVRPLLSDTELAKLPPEERAIELVRRFRNQGLPQNRPEDNYFGECLKLGYSAIPALIAAVDDHRPTRGVNSRRQGLESIGELATDAIRAISNRRFKNLNESDVYSPSPGAQSAIKTEIENWWAEYQRKGARQFLIDAAARGDENSIPSAFLLLKEFPEDAGPVIVRCYQHLTTTPTEKLNFLGWMYTANNPECIRLLRQELETGEDLSVKEAAARSLQAMGQDGTTNAMLKEWRKIPPHSNPPGAASVVRFLANSLDIDAIRELTGNLGDRPPSIRMAAIDELAGAYEKAVWNRHIQTPPGIRLLIEASLASFLADDQELWGLSGVGYRNPTIGDQAAWRLSMILPDRYVFDRSVSFEKREATRLDCLNVWRKANGLEPVSLPALLERKADDPNQISEIRFADQVLEGSEVGKALNELNGRLLSSGDLICIICEFGLHLPEGVDGIQIRAVRTSKPAGFRITVWSRKGKPPEAWQDFDWFGGVSPSKSKAFERSGTRGHQDIGNPQKWTDWKLALDQALKESPDSELVVRIGSMVIVQ